MKNKENQEKTYTKKLTDLIQVRTIYELDSKILLDPDFLRSLYIGYREIDLIDVSDTMYLSFLELYDYLENEEDL